jgi:hypothetical protein
MILVFKRKVYDTYKEKSAFFRQLCLNRDSTKGHRHDDEGLFYVKKAIWIHQA